MSKVKKKATTRKSPKVSAAKLAKCKELFMAYASLGEISKLENIPKSTLAYHSSKRWMAEREMNKAEIFATVTAAKKEQFSDITHNTVKIMQRALSHMASRTEPPTIMEAQKAADIMSSLDKIIRLDDNKPTEIAATHDAPVTIEVIQEKLSLDPFAEVDQVEFKEVKNEKDS